VTARTTCRIGPPVGHDPAWGPWTRLDDMIREALLLERDDARARLVWVLRQRAHRLFVARIRATAARLGAGEGAGG
jgi:hypothetical protein